MIDFDVIGIRFALAALFLALGMVVARLGFAIIEDKEPERRSAVVGFTLILAASGLGLAAIAAVVRIAVASVIK